MAPELPSGIAEVARFLPVSYITDGMQQLGQGGALSSLGPDLAWLAAWAVVLLACAGRLFRWE